MIGDIFKARMHRRPTDTERDAAKSVAPRVATIGVLVLEELTKGPATGEQVFAALTGAGVKTTLYTVKPRLTDAARAGLVVDSGARGRSLGGRKSIMWRLTTAEERAAFAAAQAGKEGAENGSLF